MATNAFVFCITIIVVGIGIGILASVTRSSLWNLRLPTRSPSVLQSILWYIQPGTGDPLSEYERIEREREIESRIVSRTDDDHNTDPEDW